MPICYALAKENSSCYFLRASGCPDLQWAMRLKHQGTLEHYLQEVAAVTALTDISQHGRSMILTASKIYDSLELPP